MAIWQYTLTVIPRAGVLRKYGDIPQELLIDKEGWKRYWSVKSYSDSQFELNSEDAYSIKWWEGLGIIATPIIVQIDQLFPRATFIDHTPDYAGWKGYESNAEDNDCSISIHVETDSIEEFRFRTDLRDVNKAYKFLSAMLAICSENNLMVMDTNGKLMPPNLNAVFTSLENSNAVSFLTDPNEFLERVVREQNGI